MRDKGLRVLVTRRGWALVWIPIVIIGVLHYSIPAEFAWAHDILRRLYYLPLVIAAFFGGLRGGILAAAIISATYMPHGFVHYEHLIADPQSSLDKVLEILLYFVFGSLVGYLVSLQNRRQVELRRLLAERETLTHQLVRAGRLSSLGEVVAGIAHEVKNPLHSLMGTAEIVDPLIPVNAKERRMWEIHISEIDRLRRVADRFLSFAKPQHPNIEPVDLRKVADRLLGLVSADARQKNIVVESRLPQHPVTVLGDHDQLAQVGLNIAINAVKAIGERGGRILVSVGNDMWNGCRVGVLTIENDGPEIPDNELEAIFDPFVSSGSSAGLGLAIATRIVEQHDGVIEVANEGLGVRFSILLPVDTARS